MGKERCMTTVFHPRAASLHARGSRLYVSSQNQDYDRGETETTISVTSTTDRQSWSGLTYGVYSLLLPTMARCQRRSGATPSNHYCYSERAQLRTFSTAQGLRMASKLKFSATGISTPKAAVTRKRGRVESHEELLARANERDSKIKEKEERESQEAKRLAEIDQEKKTKEKLEREKIERRVADRKARQEARLAAERQELQQKELAERVREDARERARRAAEIDPQTREIQAMELRQQRKREEEIRKMRLKKQDQSRRIAGIYALRVLCRNTRGRLKLLQGSLSRLSELENRSNPSKETKLRFDGLKEYITKQMKATLSNFSPPPLVPNFTEQEYILYFAVVNEVIRTLEDVETSWLPVNTEWKWGMEIRQQKSYSSISARDTEGGTELMNEMFKADEEDLDAEQERDQLSHLPAGYLTLQAEVGHVVKQLNRIILDIGGICELLSKANENDDGTTQSHLAFWKWYATDIRANRDAIRGNGHRYRQLFRWNSAVDQELTFSRLIISHFEAPFRLLVHHYKEIQSTAISFDRGVAPRSPSDLSGNPRNEQGLSTLTKKYTGGSDATAGLELVYTGLQDEYSRYQSLLEYQVISLAMQSVKQSEHYRLSLPLRKFWHSYLVMLENLEQLLGERYRACANESALMRAQLDMMGPAYSDLRSLVFGSHKNPSERTIMRLLKEFDTMLDRKAGQKEEDIGSVTTKELQDLNQFMRHHKIMALANVVGGPETENFRLLAFEHGWRPVYTPKIRRISKRPKDGVGLTPSPRIPKGVGRKIPSKRKAAVVVVVPRSPATSSHQDDSPKQTAAFDFGDISTRWQDDDESSVINWTPDHKIGVETLTHGDLNALTGQSSTNPSRENQIARKRRRGATAQFRAVGDRHEKRQTRLLVTERAEDSLERHAKDTKIWSRVSTQNIAKDRRSASRHLGSKDRMRAWARVPVKRRVGDKLEPRNSRTLPTDASAHLQASALTEPSDPIVEDTRDALAHEKWTTEDEGLDHDITVSGTTLVGNAFKPTSPRRAAIVPTVAAQTANVEDERPDVRDGEDIYVPLTYHISETEMDAARGAPSTSALAWWSYDKYKSPTGESVALHYCRTKQTSEKVAQLFLGKPVIGCDIEWKVNAKVGDMKQNVSLIQVACEDRIALFHIALHKGDEAEDVLAPTLKSILESPHVLKCGVNIQADFTRMRKHIGIDVVSLFELSHLHRLVQYGATKPHLVTRRFVSLAEQTRTHLCLPLFKGDERVSDWSQVLNMKQCKYAADDAYASYRLFEALKEKWHALNPRPPFPACAELGLPIQLASPLTSDTSDIDEEISIIDDSSDEEANPLQTLDELHIEEQPNYSSTLGSSYGENVFDDLTDEQLEQLQSPSKATVVSKATKASLSQSSEPESISDDVVRYPVLPPDLIGYDEPNAAFVGRLGLQPRLRASLGRSCEPYEQDQAAVDEITLRNEELEERAAENISNNHLASNGTNEDMSVQATLWAQEARSSNKHSSGRARGTLTIAALRAYYLWEHQKLDSKEIATVLRSPPLKTATVAAYVAECLQFGNMEWSDISRLQRLVKELPRQAWGRYWRIKQIASEAEGTDEDCAQN